jgi:hypothetical protein
MAREIDQLTTEILTLHETAERDYAETTVELGRRLRQAQELLEYGAWLAWLRDQVPFTPRSANNYMRLSEWAEEHPADFARFKHLGLSKLYAIMRLDWRGLRLLRTKKLHELGSGGRPLSIERMSVPQFYELAAELGGAPERDAKIEYVLRGFRQRVSRLESAADGLVARRREVGQVDVERVVQLRDSLLRAAGLLEKAFELSRRRSAG